MKRARGRCHFILELSLDLSLLLVIRFIRYVIVHFHFEVSETLKTIATPMKASAIFFL